MAAHDALTGIWEWRRTTFDHHGFKDCAGRWERIDVAGPACLCLPRIGGIPVRQTKLAPDGLEFSEDVSEARWVEERLSNFGTLRSLLPEGFPAYARMFHPAYLEDDRDRPVRWSTVASWTGRTVHPLMQFERIAGLSEDPQQMYKNPPWGSHPRIGSIPERECRTLVEALRSFTSTPDNCFFCLWEGYGNIDTSLYKPSSRVRAPGRDYLLFRGPIDAIMAFILRDGLRISGGIRRASGGRRTGRGV